MSKPTQIFLSGKVDKLIFYEFDGKPCSRRMPEKVRQTKATKGSAKLFGMAVSMSAVLRKDLANILPGKAIRKNMYVLNAALVNWLKEEKSKTPTASDPLMSLHGLPFNENRSLHSCLKFSLDIIWSRNGNSVVRIPAITPSIDIKAPPKTKSIIWKIALASCTVDNPSAPVRQAITELEMPYDNHATEIRSVELPFAVGKGELAVAVVSLMYKVANGDGASLVGISKWMPVDLVNAESW